MSRSIKGSKPPGFDYWSKRPGNICGGRCVTGKGNKYTKRQTHKAERKMNKYSEGLGFAIIGEGWDG